MTVYPLVFNIGPLTVTGFGIMMMLGFFTAGWVMQKALVDKGLNDAYAEYIIIAGVVGGILGAKLWYVALHPSTGALLSRGGLVWYGGFIGGTLAILLNGWRLNLEHGVIKFHVGWIKILWQEVFVILFGFSIGKLFQQVSKIFIGIQPVCLCCLYQAV